MARESTSGTAIPHDSPAAKARPLTIGLAAAPVTAGFFPRIQPRLPTCRAIHELSRCVATADHEFRRGLDSSGTLPAIPRYLSRIELADLPGLRVARRGFWGATLSNPPGGMSERCRRCMGTCTGLTP